MVEVTITPDGSCIVNPGPGAWACILGNSGREKQLVGSHPESTSNRMELTAAIEGLRASAMPRPPGDRLVIRQERNYEYLPKWCSNGWRKSNGDAVLNQDPWEQVDQVSQKHEIHSAWTAGHAYHAIQSRTHDLALHAARERAAVVGPPCE